jgi:putative transposase
MIVHRGFKFKLYPTPEQEEKFSQFAGVCRLVYNLAIEQRQVWGRSYKIRFYSQQSELTKLRSAYEWIAAVPQQCQTYVLRDVEVAFKKFFEGLSGYPKFRKRGRSESIKFIGREVYTIPISRKWSYVKIPKIGLVKFRDTRDLRGKICEASITHSSSGWHISFICKIEIDAVGNILPSVGIDRGIANALTLSTGEMISLPASLESLDKRYRKAQRVVSRRKKGSKRRLKAIKRAARISAKRARIRKDWHHKASRSIADRFGVVVMEDLKIQNMTKSASGTVEEPGKNVSQKSGLNRSIMEQGWGNFGVMLKYKLEERGGEFVTVPPHYTSQECSRCGFIDKGNRKSQAVFSCQECGFTAHADVNAAINILRRNTASMDVEGSHKRPVEALTTGENAINPAS